MKRPSAFLVLLGFFLLSRAGSGQADRTFVHDVEQARELDESESIARNTSLTDQQRQELTALMIKELGPMMRDLEVTSKAEIRELAAGTRARLVHLSSRPEPEVILQAADYRSGCGATGNCPTFIYRKEGDRWKKLLETSSQRIFVRGVSTQGYGDILLALHNSAWDSEVHTYNFLARDIEEQPAMMPTGKDRILTRNRIPRIRRSHHADIDRQQEAP